MAVIFRGHLQEQFLNENIRVLAQIQFSLWCLFTGN